MVNRLYLSESGWKRLEQLDCIARVQKLASRHPYLDVESYGYALKMCDQITKESDSYEYKMAANNKVMFNERIEKLFLSVYFRSISP